MSKRYFELQIESVVNQLLYQKNSIEKNVFEATRNKLDKLLLEERAERKVK